MTLSALEQKIIKQIGKTAGLPVSQFIDLCLYDRELGYYNCQDIFGTRGDFITAPEIHQSFGELIAIWLYCQWRETITPKQPFILCEMGAGLGTLMSDILRSLNKINPSMLTNASIYIVESSERLSDLQKAKLSQHHNIIWTKKLPLDKTTEPILFIANELLDAMSIDQYVKHGAKYFQRIVGYKEKLYFTEQEVSLPHIKTRLDQLDENKIIEISPQREQLIAELAQYISQYKGFALFFDYGELAPAFGDTLQAVQNHKYVDLFYQIGKSDITSHVDFHHLAQIAKKHNCASYGCTQREFLLSLNIIERGKKLCANQDENSKKQIMNSIFRLIDYENMGSIFKSFCICNSETPAPFPYNANHLL